MSEMRSQAPASKGLTVTKAKGFGRLEGHTEIYLHPARK
jgi:hypothetical protein